MKIYFTCSARGINEYGENYKKIADFIADLGHTSLDDYKRDSDPKSLYGSLHEANTKIYQEAMKNINRADLILLEISTHSLSMGYLMQQALNSGKPVIALYVTGAKPAFALGIQNEKLFLIEYSLEKLKQELEAAINAAQEVIDVRFNFFISPAIGNYLDWISKVKKIPRSVYLRALIENEMRENKEYKAE